VIPATANRRPGSRCSILSHLLHSGASERRRKHMYAQAIFL
jgi:hypothetical protein